jgi:transcription antitermination factor NusG
MPNREHNRVTETAGACLPPPITADTLPTTLDIETGVWSTPAARLPTLRALQDEVARRRFHWYALRLRSNREYDVAAALERKSIEVFLPTWWEDVRWSDRAHRTKRVLFPGYIFVRIAEECDIYAALVTRGVIQILPDSYHPMAIPQSEIDDVRRVVANKLHFEPCEFVSGDQVVIDSGPLAGVAGVVVRTRGAMHVVVSIEMLRRSVRVELDADTLIRHPDEVSA